MSINHFMLQAKLPSPDLAAELLLQVHLHEPVTMQTPPTPSKVGGLVWGPWAKAATLARATDDVELLTKLAKHGSMKVRAEVAGNAHTPAEVRTQLVAKAFKNDDDVILDAAQTGLSAPDLFVQIRSWCVDIDPTIALRQSAWPVLNQWQQDKQLNPVDAAIELLEADVPDAAIFAADFLARAGTADVGSIELAAIAAREQSGWLLRSMLLRLGSDRPDPVVSEELLFVLDRYSDAELTDVVRYLKKATFTDDVLEYVAAGELDTIVRCMRIDVNRDLIARLAPYVQNDMWPSLLNEVVNSDETLLRRIADHLFDESDRCVTELPHRVLSALLAIAGHDMAHPRVLSLLESQELREQASLLNNRHWSQNNAGVIEAWATANADEIFEANIGILRMHNYEDKVITALFALDADRTVETFGDPRAARKLPKGALTNYLQVRLDAMAPGEYDAVFREKWCLSSNELLQAYASGDRTQQRALTMLRHGNISLTRKVLSGQTDMVLDPDTVAELATDPGAAFCEPTSRGTTPAQPSGIELVRKILLHTPVGDEIADAFVDAFNITPRELVGIVPGRELVHRRFVEAFGDNTDAWRFALASVDTSEVPLKTFIASTRRLART